MTGADRSDLAGYSSEMTQENSAPEESAKAEAVQAVVDRVSAWQHGATDSTVLDELRKGLAEVGVELDESAVESLAEAIEADSGPVDAAAVVS